MRAYSYLRFSSKKQASGDSLRRQMQLAQNWCRENGVELDESLSFQDLGVSAYDKSNITKGALALFLKAVEAGQVPRGSILLVESLDRLSRANIPDAIGLLTNLVRAGIDVVTVTDGKRWDAQSIENVTDFLISVIYFARAHDESKAKSKRIAAVYQGRRERGAKIICNVAPGWLVKDRKNACWVLDEKRTESVRKVFDAFLAGVGMVAIAAQANREGWPLPSNAPKKNGWHVSRVARIIGSRATIGEYEQSDGQVEKDFFPKAVTEEEFAAAQAIAASRKDFPRRRDAEQRNVFQGLLVCGTCGASFVFKNKGSKSGGANYSSYMCASRVRGLTKCPSWPNAMRFQMMLLDKVHWLISESFTSDELIESAASDLHATEDSVALLEKRYKRLMAVAEDSDTPPAGISLRLRELESQLDSARRKLVLAKGHLETCKTDRMDFDAIEESTDRLLKETFSGTAEQRATTRALLLRHVIKIFVYPEMQAAGIAYRDTGYLRWVSFSPDTTIYQSPPELPPPYR